MRFNAKYFTVAVLFSVCIVLFIRDDESQQGLSKHRRRALQTLSSQYCDSSPNVHYTVTAQQVGDINANILSKMSTYRGENKLPAVINNEDGAQSAYAKTLIVPAVIWFVGLAITFLGGAICYFCCLCDCFNCCQCKCGSLSRDYSQNRVTNKETWVLFLLFVLSSVIQIGFIIALYILVEGDFQKGYNGSVCSAATAFDTAYDGGSFTVNGTTQSWLGLSPAITKLSTLSDLYAQAAQNLSNASSQSTSAITSDHTSMSNTLSSAYSNSKGQKLNNPDPTTAQSNPTLNSTVIDNLGPTSASNSLLGSAQFEIDTKYQLIMNATSVINSYNQQIKSNQQQTQSDINSLVSEIDDIKGKFDKFKSKTNDKADTIHRVFHGLEMGFIGIISLIIVCALLVYILFLLYKCCNINWICGLFYFFWFLFSFTTLIAFAFAIVFSPLSLVAMDGCDIIGGVLNDPTTLTKYTGLLDTSLAQNISVCIKGDGNFAASLGIPSTVALLQQYSQTISDAQAEYANLTNPSIPASYVIPNLLTYFGGIIAGTLPGFSINPVQYPSDPTIKSIAAMNSWSDYSSSSSSQQNMGQCSISRDQWVFDSANCSSSRTTISSSSPTSSFGSSDCAAISSWTSSSVSSRYTGSAFSSCQSISQSPYGQWGSVDKVVQAYFTSLSSYLASANTVFSPVYTALNNVLAVEGGSFKTNSQALYSNLNDMGNSIAALINQVSNAQKTGIFDQMNCAFIGQQFNVLYDQACNNFAPAVFATAWIAGVVGFCGLFSTLFVYCLASKLLHQRRHGPAETSPTNVPAPFSPATSGHPFPKDLQQAPAPSPGYPMFSQYPNNKM